MISKDTATKIAYAYREAEAAEKLIEDVRQSIEKFAPKDIRDGFGRRVDGLQLGVPSGDTGHRCFNVSFKLAIPILEAHLANQRSLIAALSEQAISEMQVP